MLGLDKEKYVNGSDYKKRFKQNGTKIYKKNSKKFKVAKRDLQQNGML